MHLLLCCESAEYRMNCRPGTRPDPRADQRGNPYCSQLHICATLLTTQFEHLEFGINMPQVKEVKTKGHHAVQNQTDGMP